MDTNITNTFGNSLSGTWIYTGITYPNIEYQLSLVSDQTNIGSSNINTINNEINLIGTTITKLDNKDILISSSINNLQSHDVIIGSSINSIDQDFQAFDVLVGTSVFQLQTEINLLVGVTTADYTSQLVNLGVSSNNQQLHKLENTIPTLPSNFVNSSLTNLGVLTGMRTSGVLFPSDFTVNGNQTSIQTLVGITSRPKHTYLLNDTYQYGDHHYFNANDTSGTVGVNISSSGLAINHTNTSARYDLDVSGSGLITNNLSVSGNIINTQFVSNTNQLSILGSTVNNVLGSTGYYTVLGISINSLQAYDISVSGALTNIGTSIVNTDIQLDYFQSAQSVYNRIMEIQGIVTGALNALEYTVAAFNTAQGLWNTYVLGYTQLNDAGIGVIESQITGIESDLLAINAEIVTINTTLSALSASVAALTVTVTALSIDSAIQAGNINSLESDVSDIGVSIVLLDNEDILIASSVNNHTNTLNSIIGTTITLLDNKDILLASSINILQNQDVLFGTSINNLELHKLDKNITTLPSNFVDSALQTVGLLSGLQTSGVIYASDYTQNGNRYSIQTLIGSTSRPKVAYVLNDSYQYGDNIFWNDNSNMSLGMNLGSSGLALNKTGTASRFTLDVSGSGLVTQNLSVSGSILNNGLTIIGSSINANTNQFINIGSTFKSNNIILPRSNSNGGIYDDQNHQRIQFSGGNNTYNYANDHYFYDLDGNYIFNIGTTLIETSSNNSMNIEKNLSVSGVLQSPLTSLLGVSVSNLTTNKLEKGIATLPSNFVNSSLNTLGTVYNLSTTGTFRLTDTTDENVIIIDGINPSFSNNLIVEYIQSVGDTSSAFHVGVANNKSSTSYIIKSNGNMQNANNAYGAISDIKFKSNIRDTRNYTDDFEKICFKKYTNLLSNEDQIGVVANELEQIFPGLIETNIDNLTEMGEYKSVKYSVLNMIGLKVLQELIERVKELEASLKQ